MFLYRLSPELLRADEIRNPDHRSFWVFRWLYGQKLNVGERKRSSRAGVPNLYDFSNTADETHKRSLRPVLNMTGVVPKSDKYFPCAMLRTRHTGSRGTDARALLAPAWDPPNAQEPPWPEPYPTLAPVHEVHIWTAGKWGSGGCWLAQLATRRSSTSQACNSACGSMARSRRVLKPSPQPTSSTRRGFARRTSSSTAPQKPSRRNLVRGWVRVYLLRKSNVVL